MGFIGWGIFLGGGEGGGLTFGECLGRAGCVGWDAGSPLIGVLLIFCGAYQGLFSFVIDASASFVSFSSFLISAMHIEYSSSRRHAFMLH